MFSIYTRTHLKHFIVLQKKNYKSLEQRELIDWARKFNPTNKVMVTCRETNATTTNNLDNPICSSDKGTLLMPETVFL